MGASSLNDTQKAKRKGGRFWPEWELTSVIAVLERQGYTNIPDALKDVRLELAKYRRACHLHPGVK